MRLFVIFGVNIIFIVKLSGFLVNVGMLRYDSGFWVKWGMVIMDEEYSLLVEIFCDKLIIWGLKFIIFF